MERLISAARISLALHLLAVTAAAAGEAAALGGPFPDVPLSVTIQGSGRVLSTPIVIACPPACDAMYPRYSTVTLTATPSAGWTFTQWIGSDSAMSNPTTVHMFAGRTVVAVFSPLPAQTLSVTRAGIGRGLVTSGPAGIDCGIVCSAAFAHSSLVTLFATIAPGSSFAGWSGGGCSGTEPCVVTMTESRAVTATFNVVTPLPKKGDLDGDLRSDFLWHHTTGDTAFWLIDATAVIGGGFLPTVSDTNWTIRGAGDFNGDGDTDVIWRHAATHENAIWLMSGVSYVTDLLLPPSPGGEWDIGATGDFNGDGETDIAWRNSTTGANLVWFMNDLAITSSAPIATVTDPAWKLAGGGDVNNDGRDDLVWWHSTTGTLVVWLMNGTTSYSSFVGGVSDTAWRVSAVGDFNGDSRADVAWRHAGGSIAIWFLDGAAVIGGGFVGWVDPAWELSGSR